MATLADLAMMERIRAFEETATELRKASIVVGSVHFCNGQEAIAVGAVSARADGDRVLATYRGHGWALACGLAPVALFAELLGRESGVCGGRGGSAHFSAPDVDFYGENSIVGAGAPIACGVALSAQREGRGRAVIVVFGDGAMNQGAVHESMNFAAYLSLPVVFICENNHYSELTPIDEMVRMKELYRRADAYGFPSRRVDGNDLDAVRAATVEYLAAARAGRGPALIEALTQRIVGHYYGDLQGYRPRGEVTQALLDEPIVRARAALLDSGFATTAELDALRTRIRAEIAAAADAAQAAPLARADTVREHLYA
jgi:TPP-dependent pyruvate/acetoin dehydrogenase alpha subunit